MRVGVLGGGLQGCCTALALAERGVDVILFDRNPALLSRTAVANEGKIHLGYMYAADPSLETARTMLQGALAFAPFMRRHIADPDTVLATSMPAAYVVHRDSQHSLPEVQAYIAEVHAMIAAAERGRERAYFGQDLSRTPRPWSADEVGGSFNPEAAVGVFETREVAINPVTLARALRVSIAVNPRIETRLEHVVLGADPDAKGIDVRGEGPDGPFRERFDHAVNALWDGRLALDAALGLTPGRPWLHRLKYGVSFTLPKGLERPPSATFVSGPFGEVVSYPDRLTYLTWYPTCIHGMSAEVTPPDWQTNPDEPLRSRILEGTLQAMAEVVPSLAAIDPASLTDARVKGGAIVAWGETDIYDPSSELHRRYEIGVSSHGRYHSIDPGKLTMAPLFADRCAERIAA
jgi:glycine/D-amino acid oxidase-like deaminating enzyme